MVSAAGSCAGSCDGSSGGGAGGGSCGSGGGSAPCRRCAAGRSAAAGACGKQANHHGASQAVVVCSDPALQMCTVPEMHLRRSRLPEAHIRSGTQHMCTCTEGAQGCHASWQLASDVRRAASMPAEVELLAPCRLSVLNRLQPAGAAQYGASPAAQSACAAAA